MHMQAEQYRGGTPLTPWIWKKPLCREAVDAVDSVAPLSHFQRMMPIDAVKPLTPLTLEATDAADVEAIDAVASSLFAEVKPSGLRGFTRGIKSRLRAFASSREESKVVFESSPLRKEKCNLGVTGLVAGSIHRSWAALDSW